MGAARFGHRTPGTVPGLPHPNPHGRHTEVHMEPKHGDDTAAFKQWAEKIARANERYTLNLQRAFAGLLTELKRAYGQPARDDAEMLSQHALALQANARFLKRMGPEGDLAHFADQFAKLAQMFWDLNEGVRVPMLCPALAKRSDQTLVWLARARVVIAVETLRQCGYRKSIESAAKWVAQKYPGLEQLVPRRESFEDNNLLVQ